jgi:hypothetical protein
MHLQPDDSNGAEVERPAAATAERSGPEAKSVLTWTAEILNSVEPTDKLRHIRTTEWASRSELASALEIHVDTVHRRALAAGVATRIEVTPARRCRVLYLVEDVRQKMRGAQ